MASDKVTVTIELIDEITDRLDSIEKGTQSFGKQMIGAQMAMKGASMAMGAVGSAVGAAKELIVKSIGAAANFEYNLQRIGNVGNLTADDLADLGANIRTLSLNSMFSTEEMSTAFYELAAAGDYTKEELETMMGSFTDLATATGTDLVQATKTAAKVMVGFQLGAEDSASVADTLTNAANLSALELADLAAALSFVGSTAFGAGMDIDETSAILAQLSNQGIEGTMAATSLRFAIKQMASPTKEAQRLMRKLSIDFFDAEGNMRDMADIVPDLSSAMSGLTTEQKLQYNEILFGIRAGSSMLALMNAEEAAAAGLGKSLGELTDDIGEEGVAQAQADAIMGTTKATFEVLKGTIEDLVMSLGMGIIGSEGMTNAIGALSDILADPVLQDALTTIGNVIGEVLVAVIPILGDVIESVIPIIELLSDFISDLLPIIMPLVDWIGEFLVSAFEELAPIIEDFLPVILEFAEIIMDILIPILDQFLPYLYELQPLFTALKPVIEKIGLILEALGPIITLIVDLFVMGLIANVNNLIIVLEILDPILGLILEALEFLEPVITSIIDSVRILAEAFNQFIGFLQPLVDIYNAIADIVGLDKIELPTINISQISSLNPYDTEFSYDPGASSGGGRVVPDQGGSSLGGGGGGGGNTYMIDLVVEGDVKDDETINNIYNAVTGGEFGVPE